MIKVPDRRINSPLRVVIRNIYRILGVGTVVIGRVDSGVLKAGINVMFAPSNIKTEVKSIERHNKNIVEAYPGDIIGFCLKGVSIGDIKRGYVCGSVDNPPR